MGKTFKEDFIDMFGKKKWNELQTVKHSMYKPPDSEVGQVVFRLLEMFDYECFSYGDNQGIPKEEAKALLKRHREEIFHMEGLGVPSFIGLFSGVFDFLLEEDADN